MAKAESGRGKLVDDACVGVRVVLAVAFVLHIQLEVLHSIWAKNQRKPFFVGNCLQLGNHYTPGRRQRYVRRDSLQGDLLPSRMFRLTWPLGRESRRASGDLDT